MHEFPTCLNNMKLFGGQLAKYQQRGQGALITIGAVSIAVSACDRITLVRSYLIVPVLGESGVTEFPLGANRGKSGGRKVCTHMLRSFCELGNRSLLLLCQTDIHLVRAVRVEQGVRHRSW
eukprot:6705790-Pyramimonas_sp.AAC.1